MKKSALLFSIFAFIAIAFGCGSNTSNAQNGDGSLPEIDAKQVYRAKCGICHGSDGKKMLAGAPDLTLSKLSQEEKIALITNGKGAMPPQKDIMSTKEIIAVAKYIEEFTTD